MLVFLGNGYFLNLTQVGVQTAWVEILPPCSMNSGGTLACGTKKQRGKERNSSFF